MLCVVLGWQPSPVQLSSAMRPTRMLHYAVCSPVLPVLLPAETQYLDDVLLSTPSPRSALHIKVSSTELILKVHAVTAATVTGLRESGTTSLPLLLLQLQ